MDRDALLRSVGNGIRHITYNDVAGPRYVDGHVIFVGETTTTIQMANGDEMSVLNDLIARIEPYKPTRGRFH